MLLWLLASPSPAVAGYEIAHIVERTCDPGGSLIVTDEYKGPRFEDEVLTEPGEVVACPPAGSRNTFQIAAGPERIGRERYICTFVSLFNGDGADICTRWDSVEDAKTPLQPLIAVLPDASGRLTLVGVVSHEVATVALAPPEDASQDPAVTPIGADRATELGAAGAFSFFSLEVDRRTLCADEPPGVVGRDSSGRRIATSPVPKSTSLLSAADRVPYARSLKALCGSSGPAEPAGRGWLTEMGAVFRSLLTAFF